MNNPIKRVKNDTRRFFSRLILIWIVYVVFTLLAPAAETVSRYGLTLTQANILRVTILLPLLFIWGTALLGVVWFRRYTMLLKDAEEEPAFAKFTLGLWMLTLVLLIPGFVGVFATYHPDSQNLQQFTLILRNYMSIVLYGAGFWYLWQASKSLLKTVKGVDWENMYRPIMLAVLSILTFIYIWLVFQNPFRYTSHDPLVRPTYGLPDFLILLTVILPYVLIWLFGGMTILNVWSYVQRVPGIIYRETFTYMAHGLTITILLIIGLQFLSQANASLSHTALSVVLIIIYVILLAIAAGYLLIARGAKKLAVIEEVE